MFNWFNRPKPETPGPADEPTNEPAQPSAPSPEDYLAWAKAAYKNIQTQQSKTLDPPTQTPEVNTEPESIASIKSTEASIAAAEPPAVESTIPATETPKSEAELTADQEGAPKPDLEVPSLGNVENVADIAPLPAWARETDEEIQARLAMVAAVETEENPSPSPAEAGENVAFDENFLWSAQVLAAQGRRAEDISLEEISWLKRLRQGLARTRLSLINQLKSIVGQGPLNKDAVLQIEALLLQADVGIEATEHIINTLQNKLKEEVLPPEQAIAYLKSILRDLLDAPLKSYTAPFAPEKDQLNIWLVTGVNGAGKTTTIGKLANLAKKSGYRCLIGAADTFRAAAIEQVKIWGERSSTEVIANPGKNTDPAAVVFDAIAAAQARSTELLLVDTAGRLQNKKNLMDELSKIRRIIDKKAANAKVESLLVLDATLGQNGLQQAKVFAEAAKLTGVVLTKLDGTAKGGIALAVVQQLGIPIRFIGAGEGIEDLRPFSSYEFVEALLSG